MHTSEESAGFIEGARHAVEHLFHALAQYLDVIGQVNLEISQISRGEEFFRAEFMDRGQWSPNANYHYGRYLERMKALADQRDQAVMDQRVKFDELMVQSGASLDSIAILAGSVLQVGKQVLSFRFGKKSEITAGRSIGSQQASNVVWEGRNHALHWEDPTVFEPVQSMLRTLQADVDFVIDDARSNAFEILRVLDWKTAEAVIDDLRGMVA